MVSFFVYSFIEWIYGLSRLERYNGISLMEILGEAAVGKSIGDVMKFMVDLVVKFSVGVGYLWIGLSY